MSFAVVDASVAAKWLVSEEGTEAALELRHMYRLAAPELLVAECANFLWKKVELGEFDVDEAVMAARILQQAEIELMPMRNLLDAAASIAIDLRHPAYDCMYMALAADLQCPYVTADLRLVRKVRQHGSSDVTGIVVALPDAVAE